MRQLIPALALLAAFMFSGSLKADETLLYSGTWIGKAYAIKGEWKILEEDGIRKIRFDENFSTRSGPDLKVYLSRSPIAPLQGKQVSGKSDKIAPLQSSKGSQEYNIPSDLILDDYKSLVIHCEEYAHLWGGANLQ